MRRKYSSGISINTPKIQKLNQNGFVPYMNFNKIKANIIVLSYQPGYGKTYTALKYMRQKSNTNTVYFTGRHDTIQDWIKAWDPKIKPIPVHWMGFEKICKDKSKKSLYKNYKISPSILCNGCKDFHLCDYVKQFRTYKRIFSPVEYLSKSQFKNKISKIKTIIIDERVTKIDVRGLNPDIIKQAFKIIQTPLGYRTAINQRNLRFFNAKRLKTITQQYWNTIVKAVQLKDTKILEQLENFNPSHFSEFIEWGNIYNFNKNKYGIPFFYYVFDAININPNLKVVILDASFNRELFRYFLYSYNGEKRFNHPIKVQEYTTDKKNKNTIVFRMRPQAWHPKASFIKKYDDKIVEEWVPRHIKKIREIFGEDNVGIITFKELGEKSKFLGFNVEYYGDLRSKNTFEMKPILIVLGHFFPPMPESRFDQTGNITQKGIHETIDEWFLRDTSTYQLIELKQEIYRRYGRTKKAKQWKEKFLGTSWPRRYMDKRGKTRFNPGDTVKLKPGKTIQDYFDDEIYQAIHRNRGLQNTRIIFVYCWIPEKSLFHGGERLYKIVKEFDFRKIMTNEEDTFFRSLEEQIGNRNIVNGVIRDLTYTDKSNTIIANENAIFRKNLYTNPDGTGGPATKYIEILKDGIYRRDVKNNVKDPKYKIHFPP